MFGGGIGVSYVAFADTWEWDGTSWTASGAACSPSAREWATLTYDAARGQMMLFGGVRCTATACSWSADTWTFRHERTDAVDEACPLGGDVDGDSRAGCLDPDCWRCAPSRPPADVVR